MTEVMSAAQPDRARSKSGLVRWFYPAAGLLLLVLTVAGFRLFYFEGRSHPGRPIPPPIRTLILVHGVAMSLWIVLFTVQPLLVALKKYKVHMALGRIAVVFAAVIVLTGLFVGVRSAQVTPPEVVLWGFNAKQFSAIPIMTIVMFGAFVAVGVWKRKRPAVHRACMFLGTLAALAAAVSRIDVLTNLYAGTVWERLFGPYFVTLILGAVLVAVRCALTRSLDRVLVFGWVVLAVASGLTMAIAPTGLWDAVASLYAK